jgi:hypothetical protein
MEYVEVFERYVDLEMGGDCMNPWMRFGTGQKFGEVQEWR